MAVLPTQTAVERDTSDLEADVNENPMVISHDGENPSPTAQPFHLATSESDPVRRCAQAYHLTVFL